MSVKINKETAMKLKVTGFGNSGQNVCVLSGGLATGYVEIGDMSWPVNLNLFPQCGFGEYIEVTNKVHLNNLKTKKYYS